MQDLALPPATLLDALGAPQKGAYAGRIASAEFAGGRLGGWRKKAWRYAGVFRDDLAIGAAIADWDSGLCLGMAGGGTVQTAGVPMLARNTRGRWPWALA